MHTGCGSRRVSLWGPEADGLGLMRLDGQLSLWDLGSKDECDKGVWSTGPSQDMCCGKEDISGLI